MFGGLYGLSVVGLYQLLGAFGVPTFYDKLLQVPLMNLSVRRLDRLASARWLRPLDPARLGRSLAPRLRYAAYASLWAIAFVALSATGGLGDRHPGQWLPFWDRACGEGRPRACAYLSNLQAIYCGAGSGWACNESGLLRRDEAAADPGVRTAALDAMNGSFERGCSLGFAAACRNAARVWAERQEFEQAPPTLADYPIVLRGSKGPIADRTPSALHARACEQGWRDACGSTIR
jgi:hypothetical protein